MNDSGSAHIRERFLNTLIEISEIVKKSFNSIDTNQILKLIDLIAKIDSKDGRIFVYGAGRSGFIGRCFAQRLMHLGIKSCFVSDAVTYRFGNDDLLVLISGSGETTSPKAIAGEAKKIGGKIALFTGNPKSSIAMISDLVIKVEGKMPLKQILEDVFYLSNLTWTKIDDCSRLPLSVKMNDIRLREIAGEYDRDAFRFGEEED